MFFFKLLHHFMHLTCHQETHLYYSKVKKQVTDLFMFPVAPVSAPVCSLVNAPQAHVIFWSKKPAARANVITLLFFTTDLLADIVTLQDYNACVMANCHAVNMTFSGVTIYDSHVRKISMIYPLMINPHFKENCKNVNYHYTKYKIAT